MQGKEHQIYTIDQSPLFDAITPSIVNASGHTSNGKHLVDAVFPLDAVGDESREICFADWLAGSQGTISEHDVGFAVLHQAHLAGDGLEKRRRPHDAVREVSCLLHKQGLV